MGLLERIVSSPMNVFVAATREEAVQAAISGLGTRAVPVDRQNVWPTIQRYVNDNGSFVTYNPATQDPEYIWSSVTQNAQSLGFAVSSAAYTFSQSTSFDINVTAFADNAHSTQIDLVNAATGTIISSGPLGVLLEDGSLLPSAGTTVETNNYPYNWQNIRSYSISTGALPTGSYRIIVSFIAVNYDQYPTIPTNPAALAFMVDIFTATSEFTVFNQTRGAFAGRIQDAVTAASPNDTLLVLPRTVDLTSQVFINKPLTLRGMPGSRIVLRANVIPFLAVGNNITIDNLTITSDIPFPVEFIQVGGSNNRIINNTIFGPPQQLPMSNWVVNRALVSQANNADNLLIQGNTFFSLRSGMYLNPGTTGNVVGNTIYNTKGGILIDRSVFVIEENSWGFPPNEFDIVLLAGTTFGPPYDPLSELIARNSNATISDQRTL